MCIDDVANTSAVTILNKEVELCVVLWNCIQLIWNADRPISLPELTCIIWNKEHMITLSVIEFRHVIMTSNNLKKTAELTQRKI